MATKLLAITLFWVLTIIQVYGLQTVNGRIKLTVVTTSGCSNTFNFISQQLSEAYSLYANFLDIEFIPWGRTVWNDSGFVCQFGVNDCWANRLHRCVLNMLKGNQDTQVRYMICEFTTPAAAFEEGTYRCAQTVGLNLIDLDYCVANPGDDIDRAAQEAAAAPMVTINLVPSIVFNDNIDVELHTQGRTRLASVICFALAEDPDSGITNCQNQSLTT